MPNTIKKSQPSQCFHHIDIVTLKAVPRMGDEDQSRCIACRSRALVRHRLAGRDGIEIRILSVPARPPEGMGARAGIDKASENTPKSLVSNKLEMPRIFPNHRTLRAICLPT